MDYRYAETEKSLGFVKNILSLKTNLTDTRYNEDFMCNKRGVYPFEDALSGNSRMGKFCTQTDDKHKGLRRYVLMNTRNIEVVDSHCTCKHCKNHIFPYLSANIEFMMKFFSEHNGPLVFNDLILIGFSGELA